MKFGKINKKEIMDAGIGALVVQSVPDVLKVLAPTFITSPLTGPAIAGATAYVVGMLLKKPTIGNVGLAIAVAQIIEQQVVKELIKMIAPTSAAAAGLKANATRYGLAEYTSAPRSSKNYAFAYSN